jgi:serine/threonine protein kinase
MAPEEATHFVRASDIIGSGGFGEVFLAIHSSDKKNVDKPYLAVKEMSKRLILLEHVFAERDIMLNLIDCPMVPLLLASFCTPQSVYLVMERIEGFPLSHHLHFFNDDYMTEGQVRFFTAQIVSGLLYIHRCGIAHRDIKSDNVLISTIDLKVI